MKEWFTGAGDRISFEEMLDIITEHSAEEGVVYIGSDSMVQKQKCIFCTAICLLGDTKQSNRYFIRRTKSEAGEFKTLLQRITTEVQDVSDSNKESRTSKFADMLIGYAKGSGFDCKIKPEAFAAYCVADKHSK